MIIILNGCSSAGKTAIIDEMQRMSETPLMDLGIDKFLGMMPPQYIGFGSKAREGFQFVAERDAQGPIMKIKQGAFGRSVAQIAPKMINLLAESGHDVVVDEVLLDRELLRWYLEALVHHQVYFIGIMCDLATLQKRERSRGNKSIGLSRSQIDLVHAEKTYDLVVDTTTIDPTICANTVLEFIKKVPVPTAFNAMRNVHIKK